MDELTTFFNSFKEIASISEDKLTDDVLATILEMLDENFSSEVINQSISEITNNLENQGLTKAEAVKATVALKQALDTIFYGDEVYTGNKKLLVDAVTNKIYSIIDQAIEKYHSYSIKLPMTIDEGAKVPTYAHDTDAAADLYALEDMTLEPFSYGNKIRTGVKIQLPEGWMALIIPRSSIGAKTPLRLSNSIGLIDSGYRGELGILYDNISDKPWEIKAGDRMAQLLVMPSNRFLANVVDVLTDSDRGEGGFGSSGT